MSRRCTYRTEYDPSGRIQLEVEGFGSWTPKVVRDGKRSTLEDRIGDIPAQMLKTIDAARRKTAEWEAEERRREAERQAKWEAEERAKEAARLAAAKKSREIALLKRARLWKRCGDLREFVEAARQLTGVVARSALAALGVTPQHTQKYVASGWLESGGVGVFERSGDSPTWQGGLHALQAQDGLTVHVGGLTVLATEGAGKFVRLNGRSSNACSWHRSGWISWRPAACSRICGRCDPR